MAMRSVSAATRPYRQIVRPPRTIATYPSIGAGTDTAASSVRTDSMTGALVSAEPRRPAAIVSDLRSRLAFSPSASAIAAPDATGCWQLRTRSRFAVRS